MISSEADFSFKKENQNNTNKKKHPRAFLLLFLHVFYRPSHLGQNPDLLCWQTSTITALTQDLCAGEINSYYDSLSYLQDITSIKGIQNPLHQLLNYQLLGHKTWTGQDPHGKSLDPDVKGLQKTVQGHLRWQLATAVLWKRNPVIKKKVQVWWQGTILGQTLQRRQRLCHWA